MKMPVNRLLLLLTLPVIVAIGLIAPAFGQTAIDGSTPLGLTSEQLIFLGVLLGVAMRMFLPYLAKAKAAADTSIGTGQAATKFSFDHRYAYIAIFNLVQSGILSLMFFSQAVASLGTLGGIAGFAGAFGWAYTSQDIASQFL